jgi:hypothetical protein
MFGNDLFMVFGETFQALSTLNARVLKSPVLEGPETDDRRYRIDAT